MQKFVKLERASPEPLPDTIQPLRSAWTLTARKLPDETGGLGNAYRFHPAPMMGPTVAESGITATFLRVTEPMPGEAGEGKIAAGHERDAQGLEPEPAEVVPERELSGDAGPVELRNLMPPVPDPVPEEEVWLEEPPEIEPVEPEEAAGEPREPDAELLSEEAAAPLEDSVEETAPEPSQEELIRTPAAEAHVGLGAAEATAPLPSPMPESEVSLQRPARPGEAQYSQEGTGKPGLDIEPGMQVADEIEMEAEEIEREEPADIPDEREAWEEVDQMAVGGEEGGPSGGGPAPELERWKAESMAGVNSVAAPPTGAAGLRAAPLSQTGMKAAAKYRTRADNIPAEGKKVLPKPKKVQELPELSGGDPAGITPILSAKSKLRFPKVQLPELAKSPQGFQPRLGKPPIPPPLPGAPSELEKAGGTLAGKKTASQLDTLNENLTKAPKNFDQRLPGAGLEISDKGPPPTPEVPQMLKADMGKVIAHLMAGVTEHAGASIKSARTAAYRNGELDNQYSSMGEDRVGEEQGYLEAELNRVAKAAGITENALNNHMASLNQEVDGKQKEAKKKLDEVQEKQKFELKNIGQTVEDKVRGVAQGLKDHIEEKRATSQGDLGRVVRDQRDRMLEEVTSHVSKKLVQYQNQGKVCRVQLAAALQAYKTAYLIAAKADRNRLLKLAGTDAAEQKRAAETAEQSDLWAKSQVENVGKKIAPLIQGIDPQVKSFQDQISQAGSEAKQKIRHWADAKLGVKRSWWERLIDWILDWVSQAKADTAAWEQARAQETSQALAADIQILDQIRKAAGEELSADMKTAIKGLGEEQRAIIETYYGDGPGAKNPIAAVAAGMRVRLMKQRKPVLIKAFHAAVMKKPLTDHAQLKALAIAEVPALNSYKLEVRADDLWKAFKGWGTTEDLVYKALSGLTPLGGRALEAVYLDRHKQTLKWRLKDEMSGAELDRANKLREGKQIEAQAAQLRDAVEGIGTDEDSIMAVLRNKTPEKREALKAAYKRMYHEDLDDRLSSELSGHDRQRKDALMVDNVVLADAIALDQTMSGPGTDEKGIEKIYEQNRKELEAKAAGEGWTTEKLNQEIANRNQQIEMVYNKEFGKDYQGKGSYLQTRFKQELSGAELDLSTALSRNDIPGIDAARIRLEKESAYVDDDVVNSILQKQHDRAYDDKLRDLNVAMVAEEEAYFQKTGQRWTPEERSKRQLADKEKARQYAQDEGGRKNMEALRNAYNAKSKRPWDTLDTLVVMGTSGVSGDKARMLLKQNGFLEPHQQIEFAIKGAGTREEEVDDALKGKSKQEIEEIARKWEAEHPGESFKERVLGEYSGRSGFDMQQKLEYGDPSTIKDPKIRLKMLEEKVKYENSGLGTVIAGHEGELMHKDLRELQETHVKMELLDPEDPEYQKLKAKFDYQVDVSESSVSLHRHAVDQITDIASTIAGVVAMVAAVVVGAILIAVTGGAAAPGVIPALMAALSSGWVALAGAAAAAAATVGTKQLMKGQAYGAEEMWTDIAVGGIDAIASFATAGLGAKLVKLGFLGKMATKGTAARMAAHGIAEAGEGFLGSLPAAAAGTALNDKTWEQGNPVTNMLLGTGFAVGIGTVVSGTLGMLGGIAKPPKPKPKSSSFDLLQFRGSPAERLKLWKAYKVENPGKSMKQFLKELDEAILGQQQTAARRAALQRTLRGELLQHVPAGHRSRFANVPVEMLSEADFHKLTNSRKGQAVVMFRRGKPTVVMKAGADVSALGEEGIHLLQSIDPKLKRLVRRLDEKKLAKWDKLSVAEQLDLYRTKVVVELDAQNRLLKTLRQKLAAPDLDPATRSGFMRQLRRAEASQTNLQNRLKEVDGFSPAERLRMQVGDAARPPYLKQKPRLFSKEEADDLAAHWGGPFFRRGSGGLYDHLDEIPWPTISEAQRQQLRQVIRQSDIDAVYHPNPKSADTKAKWFKRAGKTSDQWNTESQASQRLRALGFLETWESMTLSETRRAARRMKPDLDDVAFEKWFKKIESDHAAGKRLSPFSGEMISPPRPKGAGDTAPASFARPAEPGPKTWKAPSADSLPEDQLKKSINAIRSARNGLDDDLRRVIDDLAVAVEKDIAATGKLSPAARERIKGLLNRLDEQMIKTNPVLNDAWQAARKSVMEADPNSKFGKTVQKFKQGKEHVDALTDELVTIQRRMEGLDPASTEFKKLKLQQSAKTQRLASARAEFTEAANDVYSETRSRFSRNLSQTMQHVFQEHPAWFNLSKRSDLDFLYKPLPSFVEVHHLLYKSKYPELALRKRILVLATRSQDAGGLWQLHEMLHKLSSGNKKKVYEELEPDIARLLWEHLLE